jgi:hypothetical protein
LDTGGFELKRILGVSDEPKLASELVGIVADKFIEFVKIELQPPSATLAGPVCMRMKPSNLFRGLILAVRTNGSDVGTVSIH